MEKGRKQILWEIFLTYLTSNLFAFTGGNMTWPLVQHKLCVQYKLLDSDKVLENFALGQSMPGILSLNSALLTGRDIAGWAGAMAAAFATIFPAFIGMLVIAFSYTIISKIHFITAAIGGIRAASIGIILCNALTLSGNAKGKLEIVLVIFALFATFVLKWGVIPVILICGSAGVLRIFISERINKRNGQAS